jgi:hypothetical protein
MKGVANFVIKCVFYLLVLADFLSRYATCYVVMRVVM